MERHDINKEGSGGRIVIR